MKKEDVSKMGTTYATRKIRYVCFIGLLLLLCVSVILAGRIAGEVEAQWSGPSMTDPNLAVRTVVADLVTPISMAFIGANSFLVVEKNTGEVKRVVNAVVQDTVLDLGVNFASERGLLGIALHPNFPTNPGVYLFWTCRTDNPPDDPFFPDQQQCSDANMFAADTDDILSVPLLGNRWFRGSF